MVRTANKLIVSIILIIIIPAHVALGQNRASRQPAFDNFSAGNYSKAYIQFSDLLSAFPKDPLYKYYSAVCLLNMERDPAQAESLLVQALASPIKSLPGDARFWLARSQQMQGNYSDAEKTFKRFSSEAGRKEAKKLGVQEFIRQCKNESGAIILTASARNTGLISNENLNTPDKEEVSVAKSQVKEEIPVDLDNKLSQDIEEAYDNASPGQSTVVTQEKSDTAVISSSAKEVSPDTDSLVIKEESPEIIQVKDENSKADSLEPARVIKPAESQEPASPNAGIAETNTEQKEATFQDQKEESTGAFSVFEVLPEPVTDPRVGIEINPEVPKGLVYRIQVAVFRNPVKLAYFKGISPIYGFRGSTSTIYYAGMFRRLADAEKARVAVRAKGFREAFIAAQQDGKKVSVERAAVLEKEWGNIPLFSSSYEQANKADTLPPTLVFRVEATRSKQPLTNETVEAMKRFAGTRGLDIQRSSDGSLVYLIGNFITFESARDYASLLIRNGYRDAKVVARLGQKEIDVETAKQLFDTLK